MPAFRPSVSLLIKRGGYEHGYLLSNGWWGFGRRWMYPWVECRLEISPVSSTCEVRHAAGVEEFDTLMAIRRAGDVVTVHREFSDITMTLNRQSSLRLYDTGTTMNQSEGMVIFSREPLDLSYIAELLSAPSLK